jgi:hypothetical protein
VNDAESSWEIITEPTGLAAVRDALQAGGAAVFSAELTMLPQSTIPVDGTEAKKVLQMIEALEELEDVPPEELVATHPALSELPEGLLTPRGSVQNKRSAGSTALGSVGEQLGQAKAFLESMEGFPEGRSGPTFRRE